MLVHGAEHARRAGIGGAAFTVAVTLTVLQAVTATATGTVAKATSIGAIDANAGDHGSDTGGTAGEATGTGMGTNPEVKVGVSLLTETTNVTVALSPTLLIPQHPLLVPSKVQRTSTNNTTAAITATTRAIATHATPETTTIKT